MQFRNFEIDEARMAISCLERQCAKVLIDTISLLAVANCMLACKRQNANTEQAIRSALKSYDVSDTEVRSQFRKGVIKMYSNKIKRSQNTKKDLESH